MRSRLPFAVPIVTALLSANQLFAQAYTPPEPIADPYDSTPMVETVDLAPASVEAMTGAAPMDDSYGPGKDASPTPPAGKPSKPAPNPCLKSHKVLFYDNDFSYLTKPDNKACCLGDSLKRLNIGPCCQSKLDVGGQLRLRYHHERGMGQEAGTTRYQNTDTDFLLQRLRLYANYEVTNDVRFFAEGIFADVSGEGTYIPRIIDRNRGDLLNAFVDLKLTDSVTARLGRQELLYGAQRTVSPLDWANTRRTFEGAKVMFKEGDWAIDAFFTHLVPVQVDDFDDADYDQPFYGAYGVYSGMKNATLDLYYLGYENQNVGAPIRTDFSLHTFGARLNGNKGSWLYEFEGGTQFGRQSGLGVDHQAYFATAGLGYKFADACWKPTVWCYYDYASGNAPGGDFDRFNQLFPLAHKYLGFMDAVQRANIESPNVLITMSPSKKVDLLFWYYHFISNQDTDITPSIGGTPAQSLGSSDLGDELDVIVKYKICPRSNILFGWSHYWRGNKILAPTDADFFYTQWELNF